MKRVSYYMKCFKCGAPGKITLFKSSADIRVPVFCPVCGNDGQGNFRLEINQT